MLAKKITKQRENLKLIPETPGVYFFLDTTELAIYIGKAKNLRSRLTSYFANNLLPKTSQMFAESEAIKYIQTSSEIEALLLEAFLVRKNQPKYNIELRDDKTPLYIGITKEEYPRIVALRKTQLQEQELTNVFGPFIQARELKRILKFARRLFPYATHKPGKRGCLYSQIGLCNPCPSIIANTKDLEIKKALYKDYLKNISYIKKLLAGKINLLKEIFEKNMRQASKLGDFEEAQKLKLQFLALENLSHAPTEPELYLKDPNLFEDIRNRELEELTKIVSDFIPIEKISRIECFDNAHLAGTAPTASMVTFINGEADKTYYRHFKIYKAFSRSDVDMMREVLGRRQKHFEDWGKPDLLIVDGGKPQVSIAKEVLGESIPIVGLAKRYETLVFKIGNTFVEKKVPAGPALNLLQRMRDEAHRFARRYHHKLRLIHK